MKIFIDGDGCPVINLTIDIAKKYDIEVIVVKNYNHEIWDEYATIVTVDNTPDSADYYIANHICKDDIVITQDYGLAAMVLSRGAQCINQNGLIISSDNIDLLLERRHFHHEQRRKHNRYTKLGKRTKEQDQVFERQLIRLLSQSPQN